MKQLRKGIIKAAFSILVAGFLAGLTWTWAWAKQHIVWK